MVRFYCDCETLRLESADDQTGGATAFDKVVGITHAYLPMAYEKVYAMPVQWRRLALDSKSWPEEIRNEVYIQRFKSCCISRSELHARLRRQWELVGRMSERGVSWVREALAAGVGLSVAEDLEFLVRSLEVSLLLSQALVEFHRAKQDHHAERAASEHIAEALGRAAKSADEAAALAAEYFPTICDPAGAEVGGLRTRIDELRTTIRQMQKG